MSSLSPAPIRRLPDNLPGESMLRDPGLSYTPGDVYLREYWRVLFKHRLLIGAVVLAAFLISVLYAFTASPRYTAASKIRISTYEPILSDTQVESMLEQKSKEAVYLDTQIEELKSLSLADKILEDPDLAEALSNRRGGTALDASGANLEGKGDAASTFDRITGYRFPVANLQEYLGAINIRPVRRTSLVVIEATSDDPRLAALMANKHAATYIDWGRMNRTQQQSRGLTYLRSQSDELREKVGDLERELADYAEANSIVALNKDENITVQKMSQLNNLLTAATAKRIEAEKLWENASRDLSKRSAGFDDPSTQGMRSELAKLESEYGQLSAKFTPSYPKMIQLKAQIDGLKRSIEDQRSQVANGFKAKALAAADEEKNFKEELEQQKSQTFELSKRQVQYNVLNRDLTSSRELLQNVLKQIKETSLAVESNASNVSIVDNAVVPVSPSFPRKKLVVMVGLLVGLLAGVGLAFLLNYLDNTVRTPESLAEVLNLPTLGVVPSFELEDQLEKSKSPRLPYDRRAGGGANRVPGSSGPPANDETSPSGAFAAATPVLKKISNLPQQVMYITNPKSLASEAYRTIRTAILLSQAGEPPRTILVSSAQSSEGKTTSAINLAASLASAGGRVVIIDADLRRPGLTRHFGLPSGGPGLVEVITGQASLKEVAIPEILKRVTVIPSGRVPPNPAELLGSKEMIVTIQKLAEEYDYVIIDSPPILPVTDSVILSRFVDGVVLVVKGASTPRKVVKDAKARLEAVGARFLGAVLNDVDLTGGDYYYYNRYYYSYYRKEDDSDSRSVG